LNSTDWKSINYKLIFVPKVRFAPWAP